MTAAASDRHRTTAAAAAIARRPTAAVPTGRRLHGGGGGGGRSSTLEAAAALKELREATAARLGAAAAAAAALGVRPTPSANDDDDDGDHWPGVPRCRRCRGLLADDDVEHLRMTSERLRSCNWYYPRFTRHDAKALLQRMGVGAFLLRDSSDARYVYALSLRTALGVMSVRITYDRGQFVFDCAEQHVSDRLMRFECAVDLVEFYACGGGGGSSSSSSTAAQQQQPPKKLTFVDKTGNSMPMVLSRPALRTLPSLKHLCRLQVNCQLARASASAKSLPVPHSVKTYLAAYPNCV